MPPWASTRARPESPLWQNPNAMTSSGSAAAAAAAATVFGVFPAPGFRSGENSNSDSRSPSPTSPDGMLRNTFMFHPPFPDSLDTGAVVDYDSPPDFFVAQAAAVQRPMPMPGQVYHHPSAPSFSRPGCSGSAPRPIGPPPALPPNRPSSVPIHSPASGSGVVQDLDEVTQLRAELRQGRGYQAMQAAEIVQLQHVVKNLSMVQSEQAMELMLLRKESARMKLVEAEGRREIMRLRKELDCAGDLQIELTAEIACLRGELQSAADVQREQGVMMASLKAEADGAGGIVKRHALELSYLQNVLKTINSVDFVQLEDYTIRALQMELKTEARRGPPAREILVSLINASTSPASRSNLFLHISPPALAAVTAVVESPEVYSGCRQFFQSGFCHFGRGRRPCPNESSHFCLHCGRAHGTIPHLLLLYRICTKSLLNA